MLLRNAGSRQAMQCHNPKCYNMNQSVFYSENGGSMFIRNPGHFIPNETVPQLGEQIITVVKPSNPTYFQTHGSHECNSVTYSKFLFKHRHYSRIRGNYHMLFI
jgi:hypothetical protein